MLIVGLFFRGARAALPEEGGRGEGTTRSPIKFLKAKLSRRWAVQAESRNNRASERETGRRNTIFRDARNIGAFIKLNDPFLLHSSAVKRDHPLPFRFHERHFLFPAFCLFPPANPLLGSLPTIFHETRGIQGGFPAQRKDSTVKNRTKREICPPKEIGNFVKFRYNSTLDSNYLENYSPGIFPRKCAFSRRCSTLVNYQI